MGSAVSLSWGYQMIRWGATRMLKTPRLLVSKYILPSSYSDFPNNGNRSVSVDIDFGLVPCCWPNECRAHCLLYRFSSTRSTKSSRTATLTMEGQSKHGPTLYGRRIIPHRYHDSEAGNTLSTPRWLVLSPKMSTTLITVVPRLFEAVPQFIFLLDNACR